MYDIDKWIETKDELKTWAADRDLRDDWHDAEVADIEIRAVNGPLNNAFCDASEAHIVLIESNPAYTVDPQVTFAINAANLLAWACK
jgi:hypothetical protein